LGSAKPIEKKRYLDNTRTNDTMDGLNSTLKTNNTSIMNNTLAKPKTAVQKQLEELDATFEYALMKKKQSSTNQNTQLNRSSFTEVNLRGLGAARTEPENTRDVSLVQMEEASFADQDTCGVMKRSMVDSQLNESYQSKASSHYMYVEPKVTQRMSIQ
jgi:hypothetical protein